MKSNKHYASIFELDGMPRFSQALPLAIQHVVSMIVGCVTPAIIVAGAAGITEEEKVILIQASLVISALSTLLQLFTFGVRDIRLGSRLPVIIGVSFAYVPSMQAIAKDFGIGAILGAQIVGGITAFVVGLFIKQIRALFPPLITGTVVFTIGISLYPTAINYMAGGVSSPDYGSWQNWLVAFFTLAVVTALNHCTKGFMKLSSILIGMGAGYIMAACFGMVDLSGIASASWFQLPKPLYFGIDFEFSSCLSLALLFAINAVQAIGDFSATTLGGMDRQPTNLELRGAVTGYGVSNVIGAFFGGLPTATYSQNVGIVTTTKVINRCVLGLAAVFILLAGLIPKFSAVLTTIPQCVLGGATLTVFASIAMTGFKLVMTQDLGYRSTAIVGIAVALGVGLSQAPASLGTFPPLVTTIFGKSPVVMSTVTAVVLNLILPKENDTKS